MVIEYAICPSFLEDFPYYALNEDVVLNFPEMPSW
jgi:hypothetical protein